MRHLPHALGTAIVLLLATFFSAAASTIPVSPGPHAIQNAIDSPNTFNGDTLLVQYSGNPNAPFIYRENIDFKGKNIIITTTLATDSATQQLAAMSAIIDGGSLAPSVSFTTPTSAGGFNVPKNFPGPTLSYFTIRNGGVPASPGSGNSLDGGIFVTTNDGLKIVGNIFTGNNGGGVLIDGGLAYVYGNTFTRNNCWGILVDEAGVGIIYNNTITETETPVEGCHYQEFFQMPSPKNSSAILIDGENSNNTLGGRSMIYGNVITNNTQVVFPGQFALPEGGAGISIYSGSVLVESNTISDNSALARGGAIDIVGADSVEIDNNLIVGNQAVCGGGAIALNPGSLSNFRPNPGNVFTAHYSLLVASNTIVNNFSTIRDNVACSAAQQIEIVGTASPAVAFVDNIFDGRTADPSIVCGETPVTSIAKQPVFDHNMVFNSIGPFFASSCIDESVAPLNDLFGNLVAEPEFVSNNPYRLARGSPGIDAGNNGVLLSVANQEGFFSYPFSLYSFYYPDVLTPDETNPADPIYNNPAAPPFIGPADMSPSNLRFQNVTGLLNQSGQQLDIIDMGAFEASGTSSADSLTTMFMPPTGYTDMVGPGTLFAEIVSGTGLNAVPSGTVTFLMDGNQVGDPAPITPMPNPYSSAKAAGSASVAVNFTPGTHVLTATYESASKQPVPKVPDAQSVAVVIDITSTPTTLKLDADPLNADVGTPITFTVTAPPAYNGYVPTPVSLFNNQ